jgi:hypothetical protein
MSARDDLPGGRPPGKSSHAQLNSIQPDVENAAAAPTYS